MKKLQLAAEAFQLKAIYFDMRKDNVASMAFKAGFQFAIDELKNQDAHNNAVLNPEDAAQYLESFKESK